MDNSIISIELKSLKYPFSEKPILQDINLKINNGEFVAILGPTGAGKSSLLRLLNGVIPHYIDATLEGDVIVAGMNTKDHEVYELAQHVGLIFEDPEVQTVAFTVREDVAFGPSCLGLPRKEILNRVKFALKATRLLGYEDRAPSTLSGGELQSLAIAGVLSLMPEILVADEPTSMLDPLGTDQIFSILRDLNKKGKTIIISTQKIEKVVQCATRVVLMKRGEILSDGPPRKVLADADLVEKVGIRRPDIMELTYKLHKKYHLPDPKPLNLQECYSFIRKLFKEKVLHVKTLVRNVEVISRERKNPIIIVKNLHHVYPGGVHALRGVNIMINEGEFVAIIGQNGSGKTTFAKHLVGLLKPTNQDAKIIVNGSDVTSAPMDEIIRHVGYVFQNPDKQLFSETVYEECMYGLRNMNIPEDVAKKRIDEYLRILQLEDVKEEYPLLLDKGRRARVAMASILVMEPKIIIVDEPTTGQDYQESIYLMNVLKKLNEEKGLTILFITHEIPLVARYAERVIVFHEGRVLLDGDPRYVFSRTEILRRTYVCPPQITTLAQMLEQYGVPRNILSVEDFLGFLEVTKT
mgnify:CR=1 FL=1